MKEYEFLFLLGAFAGVALWFCRHITIMKAIKAIRKEAQRVRDATNISQ